MVIRRLREHARAHDWFAVLVDLVIVIIGVFLGTQANNWNAARIAANDAADHRARLFEEVTTNQDDFQYRLAYYADVRRHALQALAGLQSDGGKLGEPFLVDLYQASQINARTFRRSTYDELVSAGTLSGVGNAGLRDLAETYYRGLKVLDDSNTQLPPYRDRIRRELPYDIVNRIRTRCGDVTTESHGVVIFRLPEHCAIGLSPDAVRAAVARIRSVPELDRDLSRYIVDLDTRLSNFQGSQRRAIKFKQALAAANA